MKNVEGFENVMSNLNKQIAGIKNATMGGMISSAILIRRDMEKTPPLIPIDLGNLRASWFISTFKTLDTPTSFKGKNSAQMAAEHAISVTDAIGSSGAIGGRALSLIMGFSANYAVFVHENLNANFKGHARNKKGSRRPGAGPKFFESSIKRNTYKVLEILTKSAKIK